MSPFWYEVAVFFVGLSLVRLLLKLVDMRREHEHRKAMRKRQRAEMRRQGRFRAAMLAQQRTEMLRRRSHRQAMLALVQTGNGSLETLALHGTAAAQQLGMLMSWFQGGPVEPGADSSGSAPPPVGEPSPPPADVTPSRPPPAAPNLHGRRAAGGQQRRRWGRAAPRRVRRSRPAAPLRATRRAVRRSSLAAAYAGAARLRPAAGGPPASCPETADTSPASRPPPPAPPTDSSRSSRPPPSTPPAECTSYEPPPALPDVPHRWDAAHSEPDEDWHTIELALLGRKCRLFMTCNYDEPDHVPDHWPKDCYTQVVTLLLYSLDGRQSRDQKPLRITTWFVSTARYTREPRIAEMIRIFLDALRSEGMSFMEWANDIDGCDVDKRKRELLSYLRYVESRQLAPLVRAFLDHNDDLIAELERLDDNDLIEELEHALKEKGRSSDTWTKGSGESDGQGPSAELRPNDESDDPEDPDTST